VGTEALVADFLATHDPATTDRLDFLRARFDAGLAWVFYPEGLGGLGLPQAEQQAVDRLFAEAGAPDNRPDKNGIGLGMAAPTILAHGTDGQRRRFLRQRISAARITAIQRKLASGVERGEAQLGRRA